MSQVVAEPMEQVQVRQRGGKYLSFFLDEEEYGIEILRVREIIGLMPITQVPRTPPSIRGIINLRGKVIPVLDLRRRFRLPEVEATQQTCIIVVQSHEDVVGIVVDKVSEVLDIGAQDIDDAPAFGRDVETDYILGIGKYEGRVRLLLDIDRVLDFETFRGLSLPDAQGA
ncbi:MAG: chemotaxis protein CheW [Gemmatimonadota bacterium]|nr:chemotaxis protein CheW [Gemmatimonadota bacterium]MDH5758419.1 chemotaxis protein CheW [Gemmatimonadota bacterium]